MTFQVLPDGGAAPLRETTALVTGAGAGLGRQIALALGRRGAGLALMDVDEAGLAESVAMLPPGIECATRVVDVRDEEAVAGAVEFFHDRLKPIDVCVNNAGIISVNPIARTEVSAWRRVMDVNVTGTFIVTREWFRQLPSQQRLGRRGLLVNISSPAADGGRPLIASYGASKAAVNHLTASAAQAWRTDGVSAVVLYPGSHRDGMWSNLADQFAAVEGRSAQEIIAEREFSDSAEFGRLVADVVSVPGLRLSGTIVSHDRSVRDLLGAWDGS